MFREVLTREADWTSTFRNKIQIGRDAVESILAQCELHDFPLLSKSIGESHGLIQRERILEQAPSEEPRLESERESSSEQQSSKGEAQIADGPDHELSLQDQQRLSMPAN